MFKDQQITKCTKEYMTNGPKDIGYNHEVSKNLILIIRWIRWVETHNF